MKDHDRPINGMGIHLVRQSEGENVSFSEPWEVDGEKELLKGSKRLEGIEHIDSVMKAFHKHIVNCTEPNCGVKEFFDSVMSFRRNYLLPMLKENILPMYEANYAMLGVYILVKGNKRLFTDLIFTGLTISSELALAANK